MKKAIQVMKRKIKMNDIINKVTKLASYALVISLCMAQTALAKEAELADKVFACSQLSENQPRLSCFDALTSSNRSIVETASKPVATEQSSPSNEQKIDAFGKEHVKKSTAELTKEINAITLTVSELTKTVRGKWKITFENGQQWQQKDTTTLKLQQGDQVTLTKGAFSSIFLQKEHTNRRIKVKRLK